MTHESLTTASLKSCMMTYTGLMWQIKSDINWVSSCTDVSMARLCPWLLHTGHRCSSNGAWKLGCSLVTTMHSALETLWQCAIQIYFYHYHLLTMNVW